MKLLTDKQKLWLLSRIIKQGESYPFPPGGFNLYASPCFDDPTYIGNSPFGKNFDHQRFKVKEIKDCFCRGNFAFRTRAKDVPDMWILKSDLELRGLFESVILLFICFIPFAVYNIFQDK